MTKLDLSKQHTTENLVISCMDFRFRPLVSEWIDTQLNGSADLVAMAGASAAINNTVSQESLFSYVKIAAELHSVTNIHIVDHMDCGAYGGASKHPDRISEISMHKAELQKAQQAIEAEFPTLAVGLHLLDFDGLVALD